MLLNLSPHIRMLLAHWGCSFPTNVFIFIMRCTYIRVALHLTLPCRYCLPLPHRSVRTIVLSTCEDLIIAYNVMNDHHDYKLRNFSLRYMIQSMGY